MPPTDDRAAGVALTIASAASFGAMAIFAESAYDSGAEPLGILPVRFTIAAVVLGAAVAVRGFPSIPRTRVLGLLAAGGIGYTAQAISFFTALEHASAGLVALLLYLYPAIVTVLAAALLRQRLTSRRAGGVALALAGTALTIGPTGDGGTALGVVLGITAACVYSVYILVNTRLTEGVDPIAAAALVCAGAAVSCSLIAAVVRPDLPGTGPGWAAVVAIALVSTVIAIATFFGGLARLGPSDAATLSTFEPVVTVVLAAVVLGERVTLAQVGGGAVILAAVVMLSRAPAYSG